MADLAFRPWARPTPEQTSIEDVLARVNVERGDFRDITESSLQEEIAADGALEMSESDAENEEERGVDAADNVPGKPTTRKELFEAKGEMWQNVKAAEEQVVTALDFMSLLLSKHAPTQGKATMSPALKQRVEPGTLGTELWQKMPIDSAREAQDGTLATRIRLESLHQSADKLLSAATRLEDSVRREAEYWEQILSISGRGWNLCRIPRQAHRLAVTFGFSESSPDFSRRGIAALNTDRGGNIVLERGVGVKPKTLRVRLKRADQVVGSSSLPSLPYDGETTLETRIRHARDSLFDEELFHEMIRESRSITSLGVSMAGNAICLKPRQGTESTPTTVLCDLVPAGEERPLVENNSQRESKLAQAIALSLRLLLGQAHRERLKKRSEVPLPLSERKEGRATLPILRPIISLLMHRSAIEGLNAYLRDLLQLITTAKIDIASSNAHFAALEVSELAPCESLITDFMQPWISDAHIELKGQGDSSYSLQFRIETTLSQNLGPIFSLTIPEESNFRFGDLEGLRSAADASLASQLASSLIIVAGEGWECNKREALLVKDGGVEGKDATMWVSIDSSKNTFCLRSPNKTVRWSTNSDSSATSFWEAWQEITSP